MRQKRSRPPFGHKGLVAEFEISTEGPKDSIEYTVASDEDVEP